MITIKITGNTERKLLAIAKLRSESVQDLVNDIINKFLPTLHIIDSSSMAQGYTDMADINVNISEGHED